MRKFFTTLGSLALALALVAGAAAEERGGRARAARRAAKETSRDIGHATRDAARAVGHATRDVARDIGHAFRRLGQKLRD